MSLNENMRNSLDKIITHTIETAKLSDNNPARTQGFREKYQIKEPVDFVLGYYFNQISFSFQTVLSLENQRGINKEEAEEFVSIVLPRMNELREAVIQSFSE